MYSVKRIAFIWLLVSALMLINGEAFNLKTQLNKKQNVLVTTKIMKTAKPTKKSPMVVSKDVKQKKKKLTNADLVNRIVLLFGR